MIDYTRLHKKLTPKKDGEAWLVLRTATVDAVNSDGTVDLEMSSGVIVPDVPRLVGAYAPVGAVVQVITLRGSMLVIGAVQDIAVTAPVVKTGAVTGGPSGAASFQSLNIAFGVTFPAIPNVHVNLNTGAGAAASWVGRAFDVTTTNFDLLAYGPSDTFSASWQWTAVLAP